MNDTILLESIRFNGGHFPMSWGRINISGPDALSFLQSQTTNHVNDLKNSTFHFNSFVDLSGRIEAFFILGKEDENNIILLTPLEFLDQTLERLEKFHISEDFDVEKVENNVSILMGEFLNANAKITSLQGYFGTQKAGFTFDKIFNTENKFNNELFKNYQLLAGVPELGKEVFFGDLINDTPLDDIAVSYSKGCYPGQEAVAKIHNGRGAANKAVILETTENLSLNTFPIKIYQANKKVGEIRNSFKIDNTTYLYTHLNRANRISDKEIQVTINDLDLSVVVKYLPMFFSSVREQAELLFDTANTFFYKNEDITAIDYFKKAIMVDPSFADAYESLGVLYGREERFEDAIAVMKQLTEVDTSSVMAHTNLSMFYMKMGDKDTAEKHKAEATFKQFESFGKEADIKRKVEQEEENKNEELKRRESMFLQVLEIDVEDSLANYGMGEIELSRKDFSKSITHLDIAIRENKKYTVAYLALAKAYIGSGDIVQAKVILELGISVATQNGDMMPANEMQQLLNTYN